MPVFVIVHSGYAGGWECTPVAELLRRRGHVVFTPTLTGMGERSHLGPNVGLGTHIEDVVAVLEFEDLHDVVLCGATYGGMAVTGAANRILRQPAGPSASPTAQERQVRGRGRSPVRSASEPRPGDHNRHTG